MKYGKILAFALATVGFASCSDKDVAFNTAADVTIGFESTDVSYLETAEIVNIPVQVKGTSNGKITYTIEVKGVGNVPAAPFEPIPNNPNGDWAGNYVITSKQITIGAGESTSNIEVNVLDDYIETGDKTFEITIKSCEGATIGASTCTVTIIDNEAFPAYDQIQGNWLLNFDGGTLNVKLVGYPEGTAEHKAGLLKMGSDWDIFNGSVELENIVFSEDPANATQTDPAKKRYYITFPELPEFWAYTDSNQTKLLGPTAFAFKDGKEIPTDALIQGEFVKAEQKIVIAPEVCLGFGEFRKQGGTYLGAWAIYKDMILVRK